MMKKSFALRALAVVGVITVLNLASVAPALAMTATGETQDFVVSIALASNGPDPDVATVGDIVTAALSVTNKTSEFQDVNVQMTLTIPGGQSFDATLPVFLSPFQTISPRVAFRVNESLAKGRYAVTLAVSNPRGTASATASITVI
jgi:uncharacterized protein YfaS (alpha-2-macroglobulin family)